MLTDFQCSVHVIIAKTVPEHAVPVPVRNGFRHWRNGKIEGPGTGTGTVFGQERKNVFARSQVLFRLYFFRERMIATTDWDFIFTFYLLTEFGSLT